MSKVENIEIVTLVSRDKSTVELPLAAIMRSGTLYDVYQDVDEIASIPVNVSTRNMEIIIEYIYRGVDHLKSILEKDVKSENYEFLESLYNNAGTYLRIDEYPENPQSDEMKELKKQNPVPLSKIIASITAEMFKNKDVDQILKIIGRKRSDWTKEEWAVAKRAAEEGIEVNPNL